MGAVLVLALTYDGVWTNNLARQHELTVDTFGDLAPDQIDSALPDSDLATAVAAVRSKIDTPEQARVFVRAPTRYVALACGMAPLAAQCVRAPA